MATMEPSKALIPVERIEQAILFVRGHKVLLDSDLAALYGVPTKRLNEQVRRNQDRFPADFVIAAGGNTALGHFFPTWHAVSRGATAGIYSGISLDSDYFCNQRT